MFHSEMEEMVWPFEVEDDVDVAVIDDDVEPLEKSYVRAKTRIVNGKTVYVKEYYDKRNKKLPEHRPRRKAWVKKQDPEAVKSRRAGLASRVRDIATAIEAVKAGKSKLAAEGPAKDKALKGLRRQLEHARRQLHQHRIDHEGAVTGKEALSGIHKKWGEMRSLAGKKSLDASFQAQGGHSHFGPKEHWRAKAVHDEMARQAGSLTDASMNAGDAELSRKNLLATVHHESQAAAHALEAIAKEQGAPPGEHLGSDVPYGFTPQIQDRLFGATPYQEGDGIDVFAKRAQHAAMSAPAAAGRAYVSKVYDRFKKDNPEAHLTPKAFKEKLLLANQQRKLSLATADMSAKSDPKVVSASEINATPGRDMGGVQYHYIVSDPSQMPGLRDDASKTAPKEGDIATNEAGHRITLKNGHWQRVDKEAAKQKRKAKVKEAIKAATTPEPGEPPLPEPPSKPSPGAVGASPDNPVVDATAKQPEYRYGAAQTVDVDDLVPGQEQSQKPDVASNLAAVDAEARQGIAAVEVTKESTKVRQPSEPAPFTTGPEPPIGTPLVPSEPPAPSSAPPSPPPEAPPPPEEPIFDATVPPPPPAPSPVAAAPPAPPPPPAAPAARITPHHAYPGGVLTLPRKATPAEIKRHGLTPIAPGSHKSTAIFDASMVFSALGRAAGKGGSAKMTPRGAFLSLTNHILRSKPGAQQDMLKRLAKQSGETLATLEAELASLAHGQRAGATVQKPGLMGQIGAIFSRIKGGMGR